MTEPAGSAGKPARASRVSCIVPVYNGARYLGDALDSILAQTLPVAEIVVVDDGSTDDTPGVMDRYAGGIRAVRQVNAGPSAARNAGLAVATGELIAFLDADDLWLPDKLERQLAVLDAHPEVMLCFCGIVNFRDGSDPSGGPSEWPQSPFSPCTVLVRRPLFAEVGVFDPGLRSGEDTEWFLRVMMRKIAYKVLPDVLVRRRQHDGNLTRTHPPSPERLLRLVKMTLDRRRTEGW
jgi:glycosyltransferase involved in cell wall biosynthesis